MKRFLDYWKYASNIEKGVILTAYILVLCVSFFVGMTMTSATAGASLFMKPVAELTVGQFLLFILAIGLITK